jgi:hypothetical protein
MEGSNLDRWFTDGRPGMAPASSGSACTQLLWRRHGATGKLNVVG